MNAHLKIYLLYSYVCVHIRTYTHIYICTQGHYLLRPSQLGLMNTPTAYLQMGKTSPTAVLDMALNKRMMRLGQIAEHEVHWWFAQPAGDVEYTSCFHNKCPEHDTKQSDGELPVMQERLGMWSISSLPSLPGPLAWSGTTW